jgi:hypothetical protein
MKKTTTLVTTLIAIAFLGVGTTATAGLFLEDHFLTGGNAANNEYTVGTMEGQHPDDGANGWDDANDWNYGVVTGAGTYFNIVAGGMTYGTLTTSGGNIDAYSDEPVGEDANQFANVLRPMVDSGTPTPFFGNGDTMFVSFLMNRTGAQTAGGTEWFMKTSDGSGGGSPLAIGINDGQYSIAYGDMHKTGSYTNGTVAFLVAKVTIDTGGNETVSLWVNPTYSDASGTGPATAADLTLSDADFWASGDTLDYANTRFNQTAAPGSAYSTDEFRIGQTWADVTPGLTARPHGTMVLIQ